KSTNGSMMADEDEHSRAKNGKYRSDSGKRRGVIVYERWNDQRSYTEAAKEHSVSNLGAGLEPNRKQAADRELPRSSGKGKKRPWLAVLGDEDGRNQRGYRHCAER